MLYSFLFGVFLFILMPILTFILEKYNLKQEEINRQEKYKEDLKIHRHNKIIEKRLDRYRKKSFILERKKDKKRKNKRKRKREKTTIYGEVMKMLYGGK